MTDSYQGPRHVADANDDDTVAQLLRLAGPRAPVPAAATAVVREAARAEWQRTVRIERQRARFRRGGGLLLAAAALLLLAVLSGTVRIPFGLGAPEPVATLQGTRGEVTASFSGSPIDGLAPATALAAETVLETAGRPGSPARAALRLLNGAEVRLLPGSRLRLLASAEIELVSGALFVASDTDESRIAVHTPLGIVRDVGTRFEVRLGPENNDLTIKCLEGKVSLERGGRPRYVEAGMQLEVLADGSVLEASLPEFVTEGRTVRDLLEWVAEANGLELRFADPEVATSAGDAGVGGAPFQPGLTVDDAVVTAQMGSGVKLSYAVDGVVLLVKPGT